MPECKGDEVMKARNRPSCTLHFQKSKKRRILQPQIAKRQGTPMKRILFVCVVLILSLSMIACTNPKFGIDEGAIEKLSKAPGQIELKFVGSKKYWHYSIVNGKLLLRATEDYPPAHLEMRPYIYFPDEAPKDIPNVQGVEYHGPYRLSPDKSVMFLSITSIQDHYNARDFVLIEMQRKEVLFQKKSNNENFVEDVAWSPDSSMFAVLNESRRRSHSPVDIIFYMVGHPVDVCQYFLSIYDRNGNLLISTEVASGLVGGGGQVSWQEKIN